MKRIIIGMACVLIASVGFAQTGITSKQTTTTTTEPTTTTKTTTYTTGTVTTYTPRKTIVVRSNEGPVSFALGTAARIVNTAGDVVTAPIRTGQRVKVYYTGTGETRVVEHVEVVD